MTVTLFFPGVDLGSTQGKGWSSIFLFFARNSVWPHRLVFTRALSFVVRSQLPVFLNGL